MLKAKVDVELTIGGRKVTPEQWTKAIAQEMREEAMKTLRCTVESLNCPEHGKSPRLESQTSGQRPTLTFAYCCEKLKERAEHALK
jgi:hypothetical protein